jgi:hypothetical protein
MTTKPQTTLTDADRYEQLATYYSEQLSRDDKYEINRPNFNFLLLSYNKYLKVKDENRELKLKIKILEMGSRG